jgi:hypothetical protein
MHSLEPSGICLLQSYGIFIRVGLWPFVKLAVTSVAVARDISNSFLDAELMLFFATY